MQNHILVCHWLLLPCTAPIGLRSCMKEYRQLIDKQNGTAVLITLAECFKDPRLLPFLASGRNATCPSANS